MTTIKRMGSHYITQLWFVVMKFMALTSIYVHGAPAEYETMLSSGFYPSFVDFGPTNLQSNFDTGSYDVQSYGKQFF